jgi:mycofactocin system glycosyltransferase
VESARDRAALRVLLDRGFVEHAPAPAALTVSDVDIVIPVLDDPDRLGDLLSTLPPGADVVVVDDGSADHLAIEQVASAANARLVRHPVNLGPAAARNTGLAHTAAPFVAFIDADCLATPAWPGGLLRHFADPSVAAVAPRVTPEDDGRSLLERYEATRSSLDMGGQPELVRPGARLGFVPSAALVVRRSALHPGGFDEELRLGEDVDLVWRLADAGWLVRYDPSVSVQHRTRTRLRSWLRRKVEYGSSAPDLEERHPGNLAPARPSAWSVATIALVAAGHPAVAAAVQAIPLALLDRKLRKLPNGRLLAMSVTGQGLVADAIGVGQALRREWWPVGVAALLASPRSRAARVLALLMLVPLAIEWSVQRPHLNPAMYGGLRLLDDAAYGSGVIAGSIRGRTVRPLQPVLKVPGSRAEPRR